MPVFTGILLNQVAGPLRTIANSWASMSYNLFGYFPGPIIYGLILSDTAPTSRAAMYTIQGMNLLSVVFLSLAYLVKQNRDVKLSK
jgi:hypothetical protein